MRVPHLLAFMRWKPDLKPSDLLLAAIAAVVVGSSFLYGWNRAAPDAQLSVASSDLDLKQVYESNSHEHTLKLSNPTSQPLFVKHMSASCDCLKLTPDSGFTIEPNSFVSITADLSLKMRGTISSRPKGEDFAIVIGIDFGPKDSKQLKSSSWSLKGTILPSIQLPLAASVGNKSVRLDTIEKSFEVEAADNIDKVAAVPHFGWTISTSQIPALGNRKFLIAIVSKGKRPMGEIADRIQFIPVTDDGKQLPIAEMQIKGRVVGDFAISPEYIHFGRTENGNVAHEQIMIYSLTGRTGQVKAAVSETEDLKIIPIDQTSFGSMKGTAFRLELLSKDNGDQDRRLRFEVQGDDGIVQTVYLPVGYHGYRASNAP